MLAGAAGCLLLCAAVPGVAADAGVPQGHAARPDWAHVQARGVLRVGTPGDYAPYALWRDTGTAEGVDIALAAEVAASLGLGMELVPTSWAMLMADARAGRFDVAVGGISITPERRREAAFTRPLMRDHKVPLVRCGEQQRYDSRREIDRPDVRLIVNPGGTNERLARSAFPTARLAVHPDNPGVFDELLAGRADVFVTDGVEARLQSRLHPQLCVADAAPEWLPVGKALMIVAGADARRALDAALARALRRQSYATRLDAWLAHDWTPGSIPVPDRELAHLADERLAIVMEVARWKWNRRAPVEDAAREASLMATQREAAQRLGVPVQRVEAFLGAQILAARQLQHDLFAEWERQHAGEFAGVADLGTQLRPRIDSVNARMLRALADWDGKPAQRTGHGPLLVGNLSPEAARLALAPLESGAGTPATSQGP